MKVVLSRSTVARIRPGEQPLDLAGSQIDLKEHADAVQHVPQ
jgi:hypothetical protein